MTNLTNEQISIMRFAIGVGDSSTQMPYRNYYAPGGRDIELCMELAASGHMIEGATYWERKFYHVSEFGSLSIGLTEEQISSLRNGREA